MKSYPYTSQLMFLAVHWLVSNRACDTFAQQVGNSPNEPYDILSFVDPLIGTVNGGE